MEVSLAGGGRCYKMARVDAYSCVVSLIDRLVHHSQIVAIEGDSYRMKEAKEQATKRKSDATKKGATH